MNTQKPGFTLLELLVVVFLVGILSAVAIPSYMTAMENSRADNAVAVLKMVGAANRMYSLDNNGIYTAGAITAVCPCPATPDANACNLLGCKYLAGQDWGNHPYSVFTADGAVAVAACGGMAIPSANYLGCVARKTAGNGATTIGPYSAWGYALDVNGAIIPVNAAPATAGL